MFLCRTRLSSFLSTGMSVEAIRIVRFTKYRPESQLASWVGHSFKAQRKPFIWDACTMCSCTILLGGIVVCWDVLVELMAAPASFARINTHVCLIQTFVLSGKSWEGFLLVHWIHPSLFV